VVESHREVSFLRAVIVIAVLAVLAVISFSSGYITASIRQEEAKIIRAIYLQALPRSSHF
jgi:Tfp pilus assembly protein PilE